MLFHASDADLRYVTEFHAKHFAAFEYDFAIAFGGEAFVFESLYKAFGLHADDSFTTETAVSLDDACQFVDCEERLFHVGDRLHVIDQAIAVRKNSADISRVDALCEEFLLGVEKVLLRELFVVIVVKIADGHPVLFVFAEMLCHSAHSCHYVERMDAKMIFCHDGVV